MRKKGKVKVRGEEKKVWEREYQESNGRRAKEVRGTGGLRQHEK